MAFWKKQKNEEEPKPLRAPQFDVARFEKATGPQAPVVPAAPEQPAEPPVQEPEASSEQAPTEEPSGEELPVEPVLPAEEELVAEPVPPAEKSQEPVSDTETDTEEFIEAPEPVQEHYLFAEEAGAEFVEEPQQEPMAMVAAPLITEPVVPVVELQEEPQTDAPRSVFHDYASEAAKAVPETSELPPEQEIFSQTQSLSRSTVRIPAEQVEMVKSWAEQWGLGQDAETNEVEEDAANEPSVTDKVRELTHDSDIEKQAPSILGENMLSLARKQKRKKEKVHAAEEDIGTPKKIFRATMNILKTLCLLLVLAFLFHSYVLQRNVIQGDSMAPTLQDKDQVLVWKSFYHIERGDIVTLSSRNLGSTVQVGDLVKRVVGLPGEHVEIKEGKVFINGKPLIEPYLAKDTVTEPLDLRFQDVTLGQNQCYVLGDNRSHSLDSRVFGPVLLDDIIGDCWRRIYP